MTPVSVSHRGLWRVGLTSGFVAGGLTGWTVRNVIQWIQGQGVQTPTEGKISARGTAFQLFCIGACLTIFMCIAISMH